MAPPLATPPPALRTEGLTRLFGTHAAVDHVDLLVPEGEVFGLLGRNGAGKSTLIKMLTTLLPPSSGRAEVAGHDLAREPRRIRASVGYVPQALSADGELTGDENLQVFARLYEIPRAERRRRIDEALGFMDLQAAAGALVSTYSGGMIRRLEIAQSMLHRPRLLFLDEPTVGLDPVARETVWAHLRRLRSEFGTTIFLTTHYMEEAEALCTSFGVLRAGRLVANGTLDDLRRAAGLPDAGLERLFAHFTGEGAEAGDAYQEAADERRTAHRVA